MDVIADLRDSGSFAFDATSPAQGADAAPDASGQTRSDAATRDATMAEDAAVPVEASTSRDAADVEPGADADAPSTDAAVRDWPRLEAAHLGQPQRVVGGLGLAESPLWDPCEEKLLFPDVNASVIHRLESDGKLSTFMTDTNHANGMAFDLDGSLLLAQMGGGRGGSVARRRRDGSITVLVDKDPEGRPLHTVDDLVLRSDGTLYFTDGDFPHGFYLGFTLGALPLYILKPGMDTPSLVEGHSVSGPNGVELSPDEKTLYLSSYFGDRIVKLSVAQDGSLSAPSVFASSLTNSDSLCVDAAGNVYAGVSEGLEVIRPDGTRVKRIPIDSADGTTNCGFGGEDGTTLYVTAWTDLWKIEGMPIPGLDWVKNRSLPCGP